MVKGEKWFFVRDREEEQVGFVTRKEADFLDYVWEKRERVQTRRNAERVWDWLMKK